MFLHVSLRGLEPILIMFKTICTQRIKQLQKSSKNESLVLRLAVEGGGCSGFQYVFKMEDRAKAALAAEQEDDEDAEEDK